jgi:hypothetical protein
MYSRVQGQDIRQWDEGRIHVKQCKEERMYILEGANNRMYIMMVRGGCRAVEEDIIKRVMCGEWYITVE